MVRMVLAEEGQRISVTGLNLCLVFKKYIDCINAPCGSENQALQGQHSQHARKTLKLTLQNTTRN